MSAKSNRQKGAQPSNKTSGCVNDYAGSPIDSHYPKKRCQKVQLWLADCQGEAHQLRNNSATDAARAFDDSGNFSTDYCLHDAAQSSLHRLLQNKRNLLSCSIQAQQDRENKDSLTSHNAVIKSHYPRTNRRCPVKLQQDDRMLSSHIPTKGSSELTARPAASPMAALPDGTDDGSGQAKSYHVRVLPATCSLASRPNMLQRQCLMKKKGQQQSAYMNVLHPSDLPMRSLMSAVASRLDIEVPLLDSRADLARRSAPRFEYLFHWHAPNGQRIQASDLIASIRHPPDQTGQRRQCPVRIFISGSPSWLAKAE